MTGVQTCALPIYPYADMTQRGRNTGSFKKQAIFRRQRVRIIEDPEQVQPDQRPDVNPDSETQEMPPPDFRLLDESETQPDDVDAVPTTQQESVSSASVDSFSAVASQVDGETGKWIADLSLDNSR